MRMGRKLFHTTRYDWDRGSKYKGKGVAEIILREHLEEDRIMRWPKGMREKIQRLEVLEPAEAAVGGVYTDRSRIEGMTAVATITEAEYSELSI